MKNISHLTGLANGMKGILGFFLIVKGAVSLFLTKYRKVWILLIDLFITTFVYVSVFWVMENKDMTLFRAVVRLPHLLLFISLIGFFQYMEICPGKRISVFIWGESAGLFCILYHRISIGKKEIHIFADEHLCHFIDTYVFTAALLQIP